MTTTIRSRTVRRILRLEAQADWQAAREARAASRATLLGRRVDTLRGEARALEASLTGGQRGELARARTAAGAAAPVEPPARRPRRAPDGPRGHGAGGPMIGSPDRRCPGLAPEAV